MPVSFLKTRDNVLGDALTNFPHATKSVFSAGNFCCLRVIAISRGSLTAGNNNGNDSAKSSCSINKCSINCNERCSSELVANTEISLIKLRKNGCTCSTKQQSGNNTLLVLFLKENNSSCNGDIATSCYAVSGISQTPCSGGSKYHPCSVIIAITPDRTKRKRPCPCDIPSERVLAAISMCSILASNFVKLSFAINAPSCPMWATRHEDRPIKLELTPFSPN